MDYSALLEKFGAPLVGCVVLIVALRWVVFQLVKELRERITTLERIARKQDEQIEDLQQDRLMRADQYASTTRDLASRVADAMRDHNRLTRDLLAVLRRVVDQVGGRHAPSSADIPAAPRADDDTTKYTRGERVPA